MTIGLFANLRKPEVREILLQLMNWLEDHGVSIVVREELFQFLKGAAKAAAVLPDDQFAAKSDVAVALGGDGTILALARLIGRSRTPIFGVNLGGLGFLAEVSVDELIPSMEKVLSGKYSIEKRMVLEGVLSKPVGTDVFHAMNDIVVDRGACPRVLKIGVTVDSVYFNTYYSDGIILSTPTGSTAYSLAASGPILVPSVESIVLNPICPHTLTARPTVISADSVVELEVEPAESEAVLSVDGQTYAHLSTKSQVMIKKGDYDIHLIVFQDHNFFDLLRKKLQWGSLPRK